jgi:hypothetical protein
MKQLSLTRAQLRALREATPPETFANYQRHKFKTIVLHLRERAGGRQPPLKENGRWRRNTWNRAAAVNSDPMEGLIAAYSYNPWVRSLAVMLMRM